MMNYTYNVIVKSGTGGWSDYDNNGYLVKQDMTTPYIPRQGEVLSIQRETKKINELTNKPYKEFVNFLVREVEYWYIDKEHNGITIYVVPISPFEYE